MKPVLVCGSESKVKEWKTVMPVDWENHDLTEIQGTMEEIATDKVRRAFEIVKRPCVVEDCSLFIGKSNVPGPYVKYFDNDSILKLALGDASATAVCIVAYTDGKDVQLFKGQLEGRIVEPTTTGFAWDPIFQVDGQTLSENKNRETHRTRAIRKFAVNY